MPRPGRTLVCAPILVEEFDAALADARDGAAAGADLVEFRVDPAMDADPASGIELADRLVDQSPIPCIVTCRHAREGGEFEGREEDRIALIEAVCDGLRMPAYVDVEFAAWRGNPEVQRRVRAALDRTDGATGLILSMHDTAGRPSNLFSVVREMQGVEEARVLKVAFRARSVRDTLDVAELLAHADRPMIALAMGDEGLASRVCAGKWGGFLTFASVRDSSATAPGQPTVRDLLETFRFRDIDSTTRVYGVVGWPVGHSIGWRVHNAVFGSMGFDGVYLRFPVAPEWEHFKATITSLMDDDRFGLGGISVTIPHKEHLIRLAREGGGGHRWAIDPVAERVGAANTLARKPDGSWWVGNTDVGGVVGPMSRALGGSVVGKSIAVLGAGGAARAAAMGLAAEGARVRVFARRVERAEEIAFGASGMGGSVEALDWSMLAEWSGDAVINCTPVGMDGGPNPGESPVPATMLERWGPKTVVMDTVYRPEETVLISTARGLGHPVILGIEMYMVQGRGQVRAWVGVEAPEGIVERFVHKALASRPGG